ncbi:sodium:solute symporter family protein [Simiduia sp. 21SJ11W-1]|uniref:sodium:solute symporter family protein n=1 Tax=Simiduia sp. 21SJ11W-1 TaxID=2909669 RepID=UPI00209EC61A|nr:sodium:solute symporter family protein [Simiduia sp. 21SJ11W-1]UTA48204.1 sodium:solute symporter family protein [Simiduia sp. 21SJ11W-1]
MLLQLIALYLLISVALGLYASLKVNSTEDYVSAGRSLPMIVVIAMVFATWFGAETVLGIPATFMSEDLGGLISDPFGTTLCLVFFGLFLARPLYRMHLLTIGDYYRKRFNRPIEVAVSLAIAASYLGWVSAQVVALGLVLSVLTEGAVSMQNGILLGTFIVTLYTLFGGMWSVALTTSFQMVVIVLGLLWIGWLVSEQTGGIAPVIEQAQAAQKFNFWPELEWAAVITFVAGLLTMALGSMPQQDIFQRANTARNENIAVWGTVIGGLVYFVFAAVPIFLAYSANLIDPAMTATLLEKDPQEILPSLILNHLPLYAQVIFYGALLSVIMSTASGTMLAPSVTISENIIKGMLPDGYFSDRQFLWLTRAVVAFFAVLVALYALYSTGQSTSIHHMVENAYKVTMVMALAPLLFGIYWKKTSSFGVGLGLIMGVGSWLVCEIFWADEPLPPHFAGFLVATVCLIGGSLYRPTRA